MTRALTTTLAFAAISFTAIDAFAFGNRVTQIPNNIWGCGACHQGGGGTPRHSFGLDVERTVVGGNVDWSAVCELDSDGDGYTNGVELGDPDCIWRTGSPNPPATPTKPYDVNDYPQMPAGGTPAPMGGDPMMPMGGDPMMPMGGEPMPMGGDPMMPMGGDPMMPMGGDPMPMAGQPSTYPMGGDPMPPEGGAPEGGAPEGGAPVAPPTGGATAPTGSLGAAVEDEGCATRGGRAPWLLLPLLLIGLRRRAA